MTERLKPEDYLKTRHFIECDQMNTQRKIASFKQEKIFFMKWQKLKALLKQWFKLNKEK